MGDRRSEGETPPAVARSCSWTCKSVRSHFSIITRWLSGREISTHLEGAILIHAGMCNISAITARLRSIGAFQLKSRIRCFAFPTLHDLLH
ncbi:hypothetical protein Bxe_B1559 [Paraburkholderia xenovorans LB400]|uniref:Uncharacterized protein n=1 Tax=Paraburkholderia xenovorans (strain LB400) TaxID=266265 RepID=Q13ND4_PARXL|nr:hypothetical protein Bxe_B1559 [Paraburkholderia xenovorans LB400]